MDQAIEGDNSDAPSVLQAKRKRGRPRREKGLKHAETSRAPPGFEGAKGNRPQKVDGVYAKDDMVGQTVTGVVDGTFDAGYMLSIRIGNSNAILRGVVFKPGRYAPVTAENDVAPNVQMIRRNDKHFPAESRRWSRGRKLAIQPAGTVASKQKYALTKASPSVPPVGVRGNVVPVVLKPVDPSNRRPFSNQMPSDASQAAHLMHLEDKDVQMVEPLAMLPPGHCIPTSLIQTTARPQYGHQVAQESVQKEDGSSSEGTSEAGKGDSMVIQTPGPSQLSEIQKKSVDEAWKSKAEDYGFVAKQVCDVNKPFKTPAQTASVSTPVFNYGTGRMTELLQALQENAKDTHLPTPEQPTSASKVAFHETMSGETGMEKSVDR